MTVQENIPGVGTTDGPSWTVHDNNSVHVVWKGSGKDTSIWTTSAPTLQPNSSGVYAFAPQRQVKTASGATFATYSSPAIASLNGTLYLIYQGTTNNFIYWATSTDGITWTDKGSLGLGNRLFPQNDNQNPQTSTGPALAAANDCLYLFWKGANDNHIYWTATCDSRSGMMWAYQQQVTTPTGAPLTEISPGIALDGQTIHLAWKGQSDDNIFWATYSSQVNTNSNNDLYLDTTGPWTNQQQILTGSAHSPAMVCDSNGVVWLAFTGSNGGVSYSNLASGKWSSPTGRQGIGSSNRPALISTGNGSAGIMMAWKGANNDGGIYYGSMILP